MIQEVRTVLKHMVKDGPTGDAFVEALASITQGNVDVLTDVLPMAERIIGYPIEGTIESDEAARVMIQEETFKIIAARLIQDMEANTLPTGREEAFTGEWKQYMKTLGKDLGLKGKGLFHPVRLAITGEMSGPDVGCQVQLAGLAAEGAVTDVYAPSVSSLADRFAKLKHIMISSSVIT